MIARRPRLCVLLAVAALGLTAAGCGAVHGGASTETGACAQALPVAAHVVGDRARLVRARVLRPPAVKRLLASGALERPAGAPPAARACLLVYRGRFPRRTAPSEPYHALLIRVRHPALLGRVTAHRLPPALKSSA